MGTKGDSQTCSGFQLPTHQSNTALSPKIVKFVYQHKLNPCTLLLITHLWDYGACSKHTVYSLQQAAVLRWVICAKHGWALQGLV